MDWFVYMLLCSDGSLYSGRATDVLKKFEAHSRGKASSYTKARLPVKLMYSSGKMTKKQAKRELIRIRALSSASKVKLAAGWHSTHKEGDFRLPPED